LDSTPIKSLRSPGVVNLMTWDFYWYRKTLWTWSR